MQLKAKRAETSTLTCTDFSSTLLGIFINTEGDRHKISKELANLIDYISTGEVTYDYTRQLDEEVQELRNDTGKGVSYMTYMQTMMEERAMGFEEGTIYGREQTTKDFAIKMLKANKPYDEISEFTALTIEQISELAASIHRVH